MKETTETKTMKTKNNEGTTMEILNYLRDVLRRKKL